MSELVPDGWQSTDFGEISSRIEGGGTPSRVIPDYWHGDIPWATVKDLTDTYLSTTQESITELGLKNSSSRLIPKDTVIIATRMAVGKAVVFDRDVAINQDLKGITCSKKMETKYLFYYLKSQKSYFENIASGATVKGIKINHITDIKIPLPPIERQKQFDKQTKSIENQKQQAQDSLKKSEDLFNCLLQQAFKGELVT